MLKHRFPFLGSEEDAELLLSRFDFGKLRAEPLIPLPRLLPPHWPLLYDAGITKIMQLVFYASVPKSDSFRNRLSPRGPRLSRGSREVSLREF